MRGTIAIFVVALFAHAARADGRSPVLDVEGAAGFVVPTQVDVERSEQPVGVGLARAMVSWEQAPPAMPDAPGYATRFDVGPELGIGFLGNDQRGDAFGQVGLRLHLAIAQREMGLLHISARCGLWLAARGGVVGGEHNPMMEGALGWYIWIGHSGWRAGWEIGGIGIKNPTQSGVAMPLYSPQVHDQTAIMHFALFVGTEL